MSAVELTTEDGIATVLLNRPDRLNALSSDVLAELDAAARELEATPGIRAAIVTGAGRAFVAGADIEEIAGLDAVAGLRFCQQGQAVFSRIENLPKPVLAAVNGFALGGGCELAMACHMRIASSRARFGQPEVKLGVLPGFGGTQRLPRLVGRGVASQIILSGEMIDAAEALRIGLVNEVAEPDALLERARAVLEQCLRNGPAALAASLRAIGDGLGRPLGDGLAREAELFASLCGSDEMREGTRAFLEKREPVFRTPGSE